MKFPRHLSLLAILFVSPSTAGAHGVTLDLYDAVSIACKSLEQSLARDSRSNVRIAIHTSIHHKSTHPLLGDQNQIMSIAMGHLESKKVTLFALNPVQEPTEKKLGEVASNQGADYLITLDILISNEHPSLRLKLLQVDRGLWHRIDELNPVVFLKTIQFRKMKEPVITAQKEPTTRKLRTIADEVVSLSNCELLKDSIGEELVVVTTSEILVFGQRDPFLRMLGRFPLQRVLPKSTFRSRYPHGFTHCTKSNDGTKSLLLAQSGYTGMASLRFREENISNPEFLFQQESIQITSPQGVETVEYTPRRPWFTTSNKKSKRPSQAYLEFTFPNSSATYALLSDYTVYRIGAENSLSTFQPTSGVGFSAFATQDSEINFVTTSSLTGNATDHVKIIKGNNGAVKQQAMLPGRVKASCILRNKPLKKKRIIFAIRSDSSTSLLYEWEVIE